MSQRQPGCERLLKATANNSPNAPPPPPLTEKRQQPAPAKAPRLPRPFILLNIPKTGSNYAAVFARRADVLSLMARLGMLRRFRQLPRIVARLRSVLNRARRLRLLHFGYMNHQEHHGFYCRLPATLRSLPAISILREPVSWYLSRYLHVTNIKEREYPGRYKILQTVERALHTPGSPQHEAARVLLEKYLDREPSTQAWENISFEGFCYFMHHFYRRDVVAQHFSVEVDNRLALGSLGCRTLMFVHREPRRIFAMPPDAIEEYFADECWHQDLARGWFLRHEQLQEDLYRVLLEQLGYRREILDAARELTPSRLNASPPHHKELALRELEQKPWLREEILQSERIYSQYILPLAGVPQ